MAPSTVRAWVIAMLHEFDVSLEQGPGRAQASVAFESTAWTRAVVCGWRRAVFRLAAAAGIARPGAPGRFLRSGGQVVRWRWKKAVMRWWASRAEGSW